MLFGKKKPQVKEYDRENTKPVLKCSICNGEQIAGFQNIHTKAFEEDMFIRTPADLNEFKQKYGITEEIGKIY